MASILDGLEPEKKNEKTPSILDGIGPNAPTMGGEFKKGILSGIDSAQAAAYGAVGLAGGAVGLDGVQKFGLEGYQRNIEEAGQNAPAVGSYEDIASLKDAGLYAAGGLGQLVPFAASSIATGGVGGAIGRKVAEKGVSKLAKDAAEQAITAGIKRGATAGLAANSVGTEAGLIYGDIYDKTGQSAPGTALAYGAAAGALDVIPELGILGRLTKAPVAKEGIAKAIAKQAGAEAATEGAQTYLENRAVQSVDPTQDALSPEGVKDILNSAIIGGIGGGVFGGAGKIAEGAFAPSQTQPTQPGEQPPAASAPPRGANANLDDPNFEGFTWTGGAEQSRGGESMRWPIAALPAPQSADNGVLVAGPEGIRPQYQAEAESAAAARAQRLNDIGLTPDVVAATAKRNQVAAELQAAAQQPGAGVLTRAVGNNIASTSLAQPEQPASTPLQGEVLPPERPVVKAKSAAGALESPVIEAKRKQQDEANYQQALALPLAPPVAQKVAAGLAKRGIEADILPHPNVPGRLMVVPKSAPPAAAPEPAARQTLPAPAAAGTESAAAPAKTSSQALPSPAAVRAATKTPPTPPARQEKPREEAAPAQSQSPAPVIRPQDAAHAAEVRPQDSVQGPAQNAGQDASQGAAAPRADGAAGNRQDVAAPAAEQIVEHTTAKGKTLRGVVRNIGQAEAKAIDPYTFKKGNGYFIREKYLADQNTTAAPAVPGEGAAPARAEQASNTPAADTAPTPATVKESSTAQSDAASWWDKELTGAGRRQMMEKAGVKHPDRIRWEYVPEASKRKLEALRGAENLPAPSAEAAPADPAPGSRVYNPDGSYYTVPKEAGKKAAPTPKPAAGEESPAARWTRMTTAERAAVLKRAGMSERVLNKSFEELGVPGQRRIAKAMDQGSNVQSDAPNNAPEATNNAAPQAAKEIGTNSRGEQIFEDANGVRYVMDGNVRISAAVEMIPTRAPNGGIRYETRPRNDDERMQPVAEAAKAPAAAPQPSANTIFTEDAAAKARELLRKKLGQINTGIDPEIMQAGITLAGYHIEKGARTFAAYAKAMVADLGESVKPYLKSWYMGVKYDPRASTFDNLSSAAEVESADIDALVNQKEAPREPEADRRAVQGAVEGVLPDQLPAAREGKPAGQGSDGKRQADPGRDGRADEGRDERAGGVQRSEPPVREQRPDEVEIAGDERPLEEVAKTAPTPVSAPRPAKLTGQNPGDYSITDADKIGTGTPGERIRNNLAAVRIVKKLQAENRYATREEQAQLVKYVGWGGLKNVFNPTSKSKQEREALAELKSLLTEDELFWMGQSVLNAHYTSPAVVQGMYDLVRSFGFTGGNVLEPTVGTGNFIGLMPADMRNSSQWFASEIDPITSEIARHLYPDQQVLTATGFQKAEFPYGKFDLVIGNPPFGDEPITDTNKKRAKIDGFKIHNYIIAKSAMHLKPGGIMAVVVTNRFLDTANPQAREFLSKDFKFLGAVRLPNDAFAENAGTEVTTDLIFMQKRLPGDEAGTTDWLETGATMKNEDGETVTLNGYFAKRPELMLGKPSMNGTLYGGRRGEEFTLAARPGQNTAGLLAQIAENQEFKQWRDMLASQRAATLDAAAVSIEHNREDIPVGGYYLDGGKVFMRMDDDEQGNVRFEPLRPETPWTEKTPLGITGLARIRGMLELRERAYELIRAERLDYGKPMIESLRKQLNEDYDAFVAKFGYLNSATNLRLMEDDPRIEFGLEVGYNKGITEAAAKKIGQRPKKPSAKKAAILRERVYFPYREILSAKDARDGYSVSLSEKGKLDLDYIASLTGQPREEVTNELSDAGLIFRDPETQEWQQEDAYLSGNVKAKLKAVDGVPGYERNAEALRKVLPPDVPAERIFADIGAGWIPAEVYEDFADTIGIKNAKVSKNAAVGTVTIVSGNEASNDINLEWKNDDFDLKEIFNAAANKRPLVAYDTIGSGADKKRVVNDQRTKALTVINKKFTAFFRNWLFASSERAALLERVYNEQMNTHTDRKFDGSLLRTVGASPSIRLRRTQRNAAWRMVQTPATLLDHVVGAGKTYTIITGVMERKRLGLSKKPLVPVPNHLVGQWARDFLGMYPGANILAATEKDFSKNNRKRLFARIATGKYDAIIVGHSSLKFIPLEPETEAEFVREEIEFLEQALSQADQDGDKRTVRTIKNRIAKKQERLTRLMSAPRDNVASFEQMGVDYLAVDEFHEFKNLEYSTTMQNVVGMGNPAGSERAFDLYMKMRHVARNGGGITAATGTPISNSAVEMFTVLRYLNREEMKARGIDVFDAWAKSYAAVIPKVERTATGGLKERRVFGSFNNLSGLMQLYRQVADTVLMSDLKRIYAEEVRERNKANGTNEREEFPVPKVSGGGRQLETAAASPQQVEFMDYLVARAKAIEQNKKPEYRKIDNLLWVTNDARKMALDIRLVDPAGGDHPDNKVNRAARSIKEIYDKWDSVRGTQLVFCDLSTPAKAASKDAKEFIATAVEKAGLKSDNAAKRRLEAMPTWWDKWKYLRAQLEEMLDSEDTTSAQRESIEKFLDDTADGEAALTTADSGFSVYDELKKKLTALGIPEGEVRFIHEANTRDQKQELFDLVNGGAVRVLIGSTAKMGAGTNVQKKLVAEHHLDSPWRPSDIEQREGRIIRQGNELYEADPENFEVAIKAYSTKNTFDAVMWQTLQRKAEMLEQFRSGADTIIEDGGDAKSYAEFMAESTGSTAFRDKFRLESEIEELEAEKTRIDARRAAASRTADGAEKNIKARAETLAAAEKNYQAVVGADAAQFEGKQYRDDLSEALDAERELYRAEMAQFEKDTEAYNEARAAWEAAAGTERGRAPAKPKTPEPPSAMSARVAERSEWARMVQNIVGRLAESSKKDALDLTFTLGGVPVDVSVAPSRWSEETRIIEVVVAGDSIVRLERREVPAFEVARAITKSAVVSAANSAVSDAKWRQEATKRSVAEAATVLEKVQFTEGPRLEKARSSYKAVLAEVTRLEIQDSLRRSQTSNKYIEADTNRPLKVDFEGLPRDMKVTLDGREATVIGGPTNEGGQYFQLVKFADGTTRNAAFTDLAEAITPMLRTGGAAGTASEKPFSRSIPDGMMPKDVFRELTKAFGEKGVKALIENKVLRILPTRQYLPEELVQFLSSSKGRIMGLYDPKAHRAYLIADELKPGESAKVLLHEVGEHYGLQAMLGPEGYVRLMKEVLALKGMGNKIVSDAWAQVARNYPHKPGSALFMREVIAHVGESGDGRALPFWKRIIQAVRRFLFQNNLLPIRLTDEDVIGMVVASLRRTMSAPLRDAKPARRAPPLAAQQADPQTETPEFKRWFGDSKVVDAEGKPLVVYHGTNVDVSVFEHRSSTTKAYYFAADPATASEYTHGEEGGNVIPVHLSIRNPLEVDAKGAAFASIMVDGERTNERALVRKAQAAGHDGLILRNVLDGAGPHGETVPTDVFVAFRPEQIKSAVGNRGTFDPADPNIMLRMGDVAADLRQKAADMLNTQRTFNWWHSTVGTQYHKAQTDTLPGKKPGDMGTFGRVFERGQRFLSDVSRFAIEAADKAPELLPQLTGVRDIFKRSASRKDVEAVAAPIFQGTLTDERVYSGAELRSKFGLNDKQVRLYEQFREAVDRSLDSMALSEFSRLARNKGVDAEVRRALAAGNMESGAERIAKALDAAGKAEDAGLVRDKARKVADLKAKGYAPLMRFGQYTVSVRRGAEQVYFGLFESQAEANKMAREMREQEAGAEVTQGVLSKDAYQLFQGVTPDTLELFAEALGADEKKVFQDYLRMAVNNRSALKRLIQRKGIAGYSEDVTRVLAAFITSNARAASGNLHYGEMLDAANAIPKEKGDVKDEAIQLMRYLQNPQEEAAGLRGFLFVNYLGGSIASAAVNMTQPFMMTFPYLSQFGSGKAIGAMRRAMARAARAEPAEPSTAMDRAIRRATNEGIIAPQEIHQLYAEAIRGGSRYSLPARKLLTVWGSLFSLAEQYNRKLTFAAAFEMAEGMTTEQRGGLPAYDFAVKAINETQGIYNRGNRPNWARGAVGATVFTFKQYSVAYMEFLKRLPRKQQALALAVLVVAAGVNGIPGSDDLDDLIDTLAQSLGYDLNTKKKKRELAAAVFGEAGGDFVLNGFSALPGMPLDVQARMGLGNLIPGTGLFLRSNQDKGREVLEVLGPAGGLAQSAGDAVSALQGGSIKDAALGFAPVAIQNALKGVEMAQMGMYRDRGGRKVLDTDGYDAFIKGIGFQPSGVAKESRTISAERSSVELARAVESDIADKIARAVFEKDTQARQDAYAELREWNAKNPNARIIITPYQVQKRVQEMNKTRAQRFIKAAPPEQRTRVAEAIS